MNYSEQKHRISKIQINLIAMKKKKQYVTDTKSEESPNKNNQSQQNKKSKDKHGSQKINRDQSDENIY